MFDNGLPRLWRPVELQKIDQSTVARGKRYLEKRPLVVAKLANHLSKNSPSITWEYGADENWTMEAQKRPNNVKKKKKKKI